MDIHSNEETLAHLTIGKAIEIHKQLGPGLTKSNYLECLEYELGMEGIDFQIGIEKRISYKNIVLKDSYSIDLIVGNQLIVDIPMIQEVSELDIQRVLKIIRLNEFKLGLIINFNTALLKNGIRRVSNNKPF